MICQFVLHISYDEYLREYYFCNQSFLKNKYRLNRTLCLSGTGIIAEKSGTDSVLELKVFQAQILLVPNLRSSILLGLYMLSLLSKFL